MRPKRISHFGGEVVQIESDWLTVYLPDRQNYYHVYQIGNLHADFLGLFPVKNKWISLTEVCNQMGMIAELYTIKGFQLPKFQTYYMVTSANNLIIATRKRDDRIGVDYNTEDLYFRVYTNAFFQSQRSNDHVEMIVTKGGVPAVVEDILLMQQELTAYKNKPMGYAWAIINGFFAEEITPFNCKVGDLVEWIYDSSVKTVVEYEIDKLPAFDSTLDLQRKYLLHYAGDAKTIEYKDDLELFLVERPPIGPANGLYHHQNTAKAVRMVTHRDYAVSAQIVTAFVDGHPTWTDPLKLRILALIRESGYDRPLVFENNRIHELYKLPDNKILPAMVGEYAAVPNWQAATLEAAMYTELMGLEKYTDFNRANAQEAFGYNAISKLVGESPLKVEVNNGQRLLHVPETYQLRATAFEYDKDGVLIGWYEHTNAAGYMVNASNSTLVEFFVGHGNQFLDETYNVKIQTLDPTLNYRMYVCDKIDGQWQNNWRDVTATGQYAIQNDQLTWIINLNNFVTLVRSDKQSVIYQVEGDASEGHIEFNLTKLQFTNGQVGYDNFDVPMGVLELTMNGRPLIKNIDWVINFPKVVIHNKKYLVNPETETQDIVVRFSGFCNADLSMDDVADVGFVKWELLSRNSTFNIRDDRVLRIVCDGRLYHRDSLKFSEEDQAYLLPNAMNGVPYQVRDQMVPMRTYADGDSYTLRQASRVIDKAVSDYLTAQLPEPNQPVPNVIDERYPVYSPFLSRIIFDLLNGVIEIDVAQMPFTVAYVRGKCAEYEYLLAFDPSQPAHALDPKYVIVHPVFHDNVMTATVAQFNFLQQVNMTYTGGSVVLNHFFRLA